MPSKASALAERWVGTVRRECLDHILIFSRRHLRRVLGVYTEHYNRDRPHRAFELHPPDRRSGASEPRGWVSAAGTSSVDSSTSTRGPPAEAPNLGARHSFMSTSAARHDSYQNSGARQ